MEIDWYSILESALEILVMGFAAVGVTWFYSKRQHELSHDEFQRELFREFNHRYDDLNDELYAVLQFQDEMQELSLKKLKEKSPESISHLNDYLNLCAEEYFWFKKDRVDPAVWKAWKTGIDWWFNELEPLNELWEYEKKNGNYNSYYLNDGESFLSISEEHATDIK
jgi:hypothetical protein